MAKTVAIKSGYRPFIINASEERNANKLIKKILNQIEYQTSFKSCSICDKELFKQEGKIYNNETDNKDFHVCLKNPPLIILDEVDGVTKSSNETIVDTIINKLYFNSNKNKKKSDLKMIKNLPPIIFICNNLYIPSLRSLRQIAVRFNFERDESSIIERVRNILRMEKIDPNLLDVQTLRSICKFYRFDIRAILNYFHLMLNRNNLSKADLVNNLKNDLGEQTSYFDLMNRLLFQYSSNGGSYSYKINNYREFWKGRFQIDKRFSNQYKNISRSLDESFINSMTCLNPPKMFSQTMNFDRNE